LRESILGYARTIEEAAPAIFESAGISYREALSDQLVLVAGIGKLWALVNAQARILDSTIEILGRRTRLRVGSAVYGRGTDDFRSVVGLRDDFIRFLRLNGLEDGFFDRPLAEILLDLSQDSDVGR
jgi:hypothetical protein